MKKFIYLFLLSFTFIFSTQAAVRLPSIIGSHMVLQQKSTVKLWGWASPGEKIKINVGWDTTSYIVNANRGATWVSEIKTPAAGGPYSITIKGSNQIVLDDVLIGEVWVCSGQSNMEWSADQGLQQSKDESPNATNNQIRFFYVAKSTAEFPQDDLSGKWVVCNPEDMLHFSAVGYFFGKDINAKTGYPVGLINSNWGGTPAEVWTPTDVVKSDNDLRAASEKLQPSAWWPYVNGHCYNAMIYPLTNLAIAGAIWYQGESNVGTHYAYEKLFTSMIDSWRKAWGKDFPFYFVQIAPYSYGDDNINGALLRDAQTRASYHLKTGMVVVSDLVSDIKNIHPIDKINVSKRLANYALAETYGVTGLNYKSPVYRAHVAEKGKIRISFDNVPTTLISKNGAALTDFYVAGEDNKFVAAEAKIEGKTVVVSSKEVKDPIAVRFGFNNTATPNLVTAEGLPVNLFRTDK
jgi:sialate O-acetylesterase